MVLIWLLSRSRANQTQKMTRASKQMEGINISVTCIPKTQQKSFYPFYVAHKQITHCKASCHHHHIHAQQNNWRQMSTSSRCQQLGGWIHYHLLLATRLLLLLYYHHLQKHSVKVEYREQLKWALGTLACTTPKHNVMPSSSHPSTTKTTEVLAIPFHAEEQFKSLI